MKKVTTTHRKMKDLNIVMEGDKLLIRVLMSDDKEECYCPDKQPGSPLTSHSGMTGSPWNL